MLNSVVFQARLRDELQASGISGQMGIPADLLSKYVVVQLMTLHTLNKDCLVRLEQGQMDYQVKDISDSGITKVTNKL